MNVTPVQNNSQSFGMAFKLKGDGAKKLATFLEETNSATNKHVMEDLIKPINTLKTNVVYDGENVLIEGVPVSEHCPIAMPDTNKRDLQYTLDGGEYVYHIEYKEPRNFVDVYEPYPLLQRLFNAREIAKDIEVQAAKEAYRAQQTAEKEARIAETAQKLQDLYG